MREPLEDVEKPPRAILDYGLGWAAEGYLPDGVTVVPDGDTPPEWSITEESGAEVGSAVALIVDDDSVLNDDTETWVRLSGGTSGLNYIVAGFAVLSNGEQDEYTFRVCVR